MAKGLATFFGIPQWQELLRAVCEPIDASSGRLVLGTPLSLAAIVVVLSVTFFIGKTAAPDFDFPSLALGICTILGILLTQRAGIALFRDDQFFTHLRLVHYAFALGCIPGVLLLLGGEITVPHLSTSDRVIPSEGASLMSALWFAFLVSAWAAVTEEVLFRATFIGILRRSRWYSGSRTADLFIVFLSASAFGLSHLPSWGVSLAVANFGIGLGLGLAFLACKERLLPLIVYHFLFDFIGIIIIMSFSS